jgi:hypothetical protein
VTQPAKAWSKHFQRCLLVHAGNGENHPQITAFGQERRFIPETVKVDVGVENRALFPLSSGTDRLILNQFKSENLRTYPADRVAA